MEIKEINQILDIEKACLGEYDACLTTVELLNYFIKTAFNGKTIDYYNEAIKNPKNPDNLNMILTIFLVFLRYEQAVKFASIMSKSKEAKIKNDEITTFIKNRRDEIINIDEIKKNPIVYNLLKNIPF